MKQIGNPASVRKAYVLVNKFAAALACGARQNESFLVPHAFDESSGGQVANIQYCEHEDSDDNCRRNLAGPELPPSRPWAVPH